MSRILFLSVPAHLRFSAGVREFATECADLANFSSRDKNMFRLIVDELFMNAVRYGSDPESDVTVRFEVSEAKIRGMIEDQGRGKEKVSAKKLIQILEAEKENNSLHKTHGRGLAQIASMLTSFFQISDRPEGGISVVFEKEATPAPEELPTEVSEETVVHTDAGDMPEVTFTISGEIDLMNLDEKSKPIDEFFADLKRPHSIILDVSQLRYCNSTFIAKIAGWYTIGKRKGALLKMKGVTNEIFEILDLVGLSNVLSLVRS